jgi:hypothetical protein
LGEEEYKYVYGSTDKYRMNMGIRGLEEEERKRRKRKKRVDDRSEVYKGREG